MASIAKVETIASGDSLLASQQVQSAFGGLCNRRERWGLSRRGWLATVAFLAASVSASLLFLHSFLAVTDPVPSDVLVVEGWLPNDALKSAIVEYRTHSYRMIVCTGGPFRTSIQTRLGDTHAHSAAERLEKLGIPREVIHVVPSRNASLDRTFAAAIALRLWVEEQPAGLRSFNLVTLGPHARRSRLLYQKAFGNQAIVGIIAIPDAEYDPNAWWKYSEGTKNVVSELIGYFYARFFFRKANESVH